MTTINNYEHYDDCTIIDKNRMIHHTNCPHYNNPNNISINSNNQRIRIKRPKSALGPFFQHGSSFNFTNIVPSGITQSTSYSSSNSATTPSNSSNNNSGHNSFFKQISHKQDKYSYFSKKDDEGSHNSESKSNRSSSTSSSNPNSNNLNSSYMALKKNFKLGSSSIQAPLLNKNFHNFNFLNPNQVKNQNHKIYLFNRQRYFI